MLIRYLSVFYDFLILTLTVFFNVFEDNFYFLEMVKKLHFLGQNTCVFFNFFVNLSA